MSDEEIKNEEAPQYMSEIICPEDPDSHLILERIVAQLKTCYDPEIPVDIYSLGLIYKIEIEPTHDVKINMTLTSPSCPVAETLPPEVENKIKEIGGVTSTTLTVVWEPTWEPSRMSEDAKLQLNMF